MLTSKIKKVWLNIDKPTKKCTIHGSPNCIYVTGKAETPNKGIDELKRDGGWLRFHNEYKAADYQQLHFPDYNLHKHC